MLQTRNGDSFCDYFQLETDLVKLLLWLCAVTKTGASVIAEFVYHKLGT